MTKSMTREDFLQSVDRLVELPLGTLKGSEYLSDLEHWNSLAMISFIALADSHNRVSLSARQLMSCTTVDDLLNVARVD